MQLFALDAKERVVAAKHAAKGTDYFCRECQGVVRVRGGPHRQQHFYHLRPNASCRQSQKSLTHLRIQEYLHRLFPEGECALERRFSDIGRIADVVWEPMKVVFEVQCSGISSEEVQRRNADYAGAGYRVVWILHERRFNSWRQAPAESVLDGIPHYYTDMDSKGRGGFYDQVAVVRKGRRRKIFAAKPVDLSTLRIFDRGEMRSSEAFPELIGRRGSRWPFYFSGDAIDRCFRKELAVLQALEKAEAIDKGEASSNSFLSIAHRVVNRVLVRPYRLLFRLLLESCCR